MSSRRFVILNSTKQFLLSSCTNFTSLRHTNGNFHLINRFLNDLDRLLRCKQIRLTHAVCTCTRTEEREVLENNPYSFDIVNAKNFSGSIRFAVFSTWK